MNDTQPTNRSINVPGRSQAVPVSLRQQATAANIARDHVIQAYESATVQHETTNTANADTPLPQTYNRKHSDDPASFDWQNYHSAWQNYYQQYYHRYYAGAMHAERQKQLEDRATVAATPGIVTGVDSASLAANQTPTSKLRSELLEKVRQRAKKLRHSGHFWPVVTALGVGLAFFLLQFNKVIAAQVSAFVSPSAAVTDNIITDPNVSPNVGPDPRLVIPKINVDVPLVFDITSLDNDTSQKGLERGVIHYPLPGANNLPGETGNGVYLGHSSNEVFAAGSYKFVFVRLDALQPGDTFYIHYQGKRYIYRVNEKKVIKPTQVNELIRPTDKPMVTLITCVPIGTATNRLLVFADQISPDPTQATQGSSETNQDPGNIPAGQAPNFLQQLFGG